MFIHITTRLAYGIFGLYRTVEEPRNDKKMQTYTTARRCHPIRQEPKTEQKRPDKNGQLMCNSGNVGTGMNLGILLSSSPHYSCANHIKNVELITGYFYDHTQSKQQAHPPRRIYFLEHVWSNFPKYPPDRHEQANKKVMIKNSKFF